VPTSNWATVVTAASRYGPGPSLGRSNRKCQRCLQFSMGPCSNWITYFRFTPGPSGREPPNPGAERGDRGRKTRRRSRRAPPPELRDGRRKRLRLAVLRFSAPAPSRCHQVLRFEFDLAHAPLVYPLACVALSFTGHLPRTVVARALAAPPLSPCGGSFAQVMRSDEREISWLGLLQEEPYPDQGSGSVW